MSWTISAIAATRRIGERRARDERLEGAAVALVGELAPDHVEADLARRRARGPCASTKRKRASGSTKRRTSQARGDAVDVDAAARDPGAADELARAAAPRGRRVAAAAACEARLERRERGLGLGAPGRREEVDARAISRAASSAARARAASSASAARRRAAASSGERLARLARRAPRSRRRARAGSAPRAPRPRCPRRSPPSQTYASPPPATASCGDPLEVLEAASVLRQDVDRVLQRDRADLREALAHLRAQVERPRRGAGG